MSKTLRLSDKSLAILNMLANGYSHEQIIGRHSDFTYLDICEAAREALRLSAPRKSADERLSAIRQQHPRAYERWSDDEDDDLSRMFQEGREVDELAVRFQRRRSAIRSRLIRLGPDGSRIVVRQHGRTGCPRRARPDRMTGAPTSTEFLDDLRR